MPYLCPMCNTLQNNDCCHECYLCRNKYICKDCKVAWAETEKCMEPVYIYEMCWYEKPRSSKPHTIMYYANEKDTRWGHNWPKGHNGSDRCEVHVVMVTKDSDSYKSALSNSKVAKD